MPEKFGMFGLWQIILWVVFGEFELDPQAMFSKQNESIRYFILHVLRLWRLRPKR